jgi:hypothetical protein
MVHRPQGADNMKTTLPRLPAGFNSPDDDWLSQIPGSSNRARCVADIEEYGRAIIAQARAEWEAELKVVAWADAAAIKLLSKGFHAVVFPEPRDTHLKPLAIIPSTKEGHEDQ